MLKADFEKIGDAWYAPIMGNTNNNTPAKSTFGIGSKAIVNGEIAITERPSVLSVGDTIISNSFGISPKVTNILSNKIVLDDPLLNQAISFLMYEKNQNIDGGEIIGDYLEVELTCDATDEVILTSMTTELIKSYNS